MAAQVIRAFLVLAMSVVAGFVVFGTALIAVIVI